MRRLRRLVDDEAGVIGGIEVIPFGLLVFVMGTLLLMNAWAVIDAKLAASAAAREAVRAFVESGADDDPVAEADAAARRAFGGHRENVADLDVNPVSGTVFQRCARATFEVTYVVPIIALPMMDRESGTITVTGRHSEIVDPYRDGVPFDPDEAVTPC